MLDGLSPGNRSNVMKSTLDRADRMFVETLHRMGSATVQRLCEELNVTATAVRNRLTRLEPLGLIARQPAEADGRGRPGFVYQVTGQGLRKLGDNYSDLALTLWREMRNLEPGDLRRRLFDSICNALAGRFGRRVNAADAVVERMRALNAELTEHGFDVEVDVSGRLPVLRETNCPYRDLAEADASICELEQAVFEQVLGARVELTHRCLDGHNCCEFAIRERTEIS